MSTLADNLSALATRIEHAATAAGRDPAEVRLLAAWCEMRGDFRHFRADRVVALHDTGQRYPEQRHHLLKRWGEQRRQRSVDC